MGMMPVYYTTTNLKKRTQKRKPGWQQRELEHQAWLKKHGIDNTKRVKKEFEPLVATKEPYRREVNLPPCSNNIGGVAPRKEVPVYTGEYEIGQAYNKGNLVVLSKEDAKDESTGKRR